MFSHFIGCMRILASFSDMLLARGQIDRSPKFGIVDRLNFSDLKVRVDRLNFSWVKAVLRDVSSVGQPHETDASLSHSIIFRHMML